jgi:endonuclease G, mitochondrial
MSLPRHVSALTLVALLFSGCQSVVTVPVQSMLQSERTQREAGLNPTERRWLAKNCFEGEPELTQAIAGVNREVVREGYALLHSSYFRLPLWVCEGLDAEQFLGAEGRSNKFFADPSLPDGERSELKDYRGSGFDRGHQAPAGDFNASRKLKDETFSLANMAPQQGPGFNQDIWRWLEDEARSMVQTSGRGYIITGPMFYDADEEPGSARADGLVDVRWIGKGRVAVPTHFYKIVITFDRDTPHCVAFVLQNKKYPHAARYDFRTHIKSVDWIEARTGLNFMPELGPDQEKRLEHVEGSIEPVAPIR